MSFDYADYVLQKCAIRDSKKPTEAVRAYADTFLRFVQPFVEMKNCVSLGNKVAFQAFVRTNKISPIF